MEVLNVLQIKNKREQREYESFEKLYKQVSHRIKHYASLNQEELTHSVPTILLGLPLYDANKASLYIVGKLLKEGFLAQHLYDNHLYVSWKKKEVEKKMKVKIHFEKQEHEKKEFKESVNKKFLTIQNVSKSTHNALSKLHQRAHNITLHR